MSELTLAVDSVAIRRAGEVVELAARAFAESGRRHPSPLAESSLGPSDAARAVVTAAAHGLARAQDAGLGLAERSRTMAGAMHTAAAMFEIVDSAIGTFR